MDLQLSINLREEKRAKAAAEGLKGGRPKRAKVNVAHEGTKLSIHVQAEDAVAMRSVVNSYLRLLDACLKITEG